LKKNLNITQVFGSGLALILIALLIFLFSEKIFFLHAAMVLTVLLMIWPAPFRYFGIVWFALGEALGYVISRILLTVIYLFLVIPVSIFKRGGIRCNMNLEHFKKGNESVFKDRNHIFDSGDLLKPF
jgi:hypothetical protein